MKNLQGVFIIVFLSMSLVIQAQPRFDIDQQIKILKAELDLSDEQCDSIKIVLKDTREKMMEMRENTGDDRSEMREQMREIMENSQTKVKSFLTDEQKAKYEKYLEERRKEMRGRFRDRR